MPLRGRSRFAAGLLLGSAALVGCTTDRNTAGSPGVFPWVSQADSPGSRRELKNASHLDLTYAQWQEQLGNLPAAEESYRRVLKDHPDSLDAMVGLARLEQLAGRTDSAERAYRRAVEVAPGNPQALDALGQFYASQKRWGDAASAHAMATQAAPGNAVYQHHYAVALARAGNIGEALAQFTQAVGEAEGHYNLGYILYEQGRTDLAEREFLQAVALRPDLEAAHAMLDELRRGGEDDAMLARSAPAARPPVMQTAAAAPAEYRGQVTQAGAASASAGSPPPQWQMPAQGDMSALQAEQLRNQVATPAQP